MNNPREDRRIRRTKKMLKQSLAELMQQKDFQNITVKDITDRADLNRGTFYLHYTDPYDLLQKLENDTILDFQDMIDTHVSQTSRQSILPVLEPIVAYIFENATICRCLFDNTAANTFVQKFRQLIFYNGASLIKKRFPDARPQDAEYFFSFITYGLAGLVKQWFETDLSMPQRDLVVLADTMVSATAQVLQPHTP